MLCLLFTYNALLESLCFGSKFNVFLIKLGQKHIENTILNLNYKESKTIQVIYINRWNLEQITYASYKFSLLLKFENNPNSIIFISIFLFMFILNCLILMHVASELNGVANVEKTLQGWWKNIIM